MSSAGIYNGFDSYLLAMPNIPRLIPEGEAFNPQGHEPYLSSRMAAYVRRPAASGPTPVYIESGTFQVNVHRPAHEGRGAGNALADQLVAYFARTQGFVTTDGLWVLFVSASAQPMISGATFITVPVTVEWQTTSF